MNHFYKAVRKVGIKLCSSASFDLVCGFFERHAFSVRSVGGHCIPRVAQRDYSRTVWDGYSRETVRVSMTIKKLMMMSGYPSLI